MSCLSCVQPLKLHHRPSNRRAYVKGTGDRVLNLPLKCAESLSQAIGGGLTVSGTINQCRPGERKTWMFIPAPRVREVVMMLENKGAITNFDAW